MGHAGQCAQVGIKGLFLCCMTLTLSSLAGMSEPPMHAFAPLKIQHKRTCEDSNLTEFSGFLGFTWPSTKLKNCWKTNYNSVSGT